MLEKSQVGKLCLKGVNLIRENSAYLIKQLKVPTPKQKRVLLLEQVTMGLHTNSDTA